MTIPPDLLNDGKVYQALVNLRTDSNFKIFNEFIRNLEFFLLGKCGVVPKEHIDMVQGAFQILRDVVNEIETAPEMLDKIKNKEPTKIH